MSRFSCVLAAAFTVSAMAQTVTYTPGQPIVIGGVTYVLENNQFVRLTPVVPTAAPTTATRTPITRAPVSSACIDSTTFDMGEGVCSTYAIGERNADFCTDDGADVECPVACGVCGPNAPAACTDSPTYDLGHGDCGTYAEGALNHQYCEQDEGALEACPVACGVGCAAATIAPTRGTTIPPTTGGCQDSDTFEGGYGGCSTYLTSNKAFCVEDGADIECPVSCGTCEDVCIDSTTWESTYGKCDSYGYGFPNHEFCTSDGANTKCPFSCLTCSGDKARAPRMVQAPADVPNFLCNKHSDCDPTTWSYCSSCSLCMIEAKSKNQMLSTFCPSCSTHFPGEATTGVCTSAEYCLLDDDSVDGRCPRTFAPTSAPTSAPTTPAPTP